MAIPRAGAGKRGRQAQLFATFASSRLCVESNRPAARTGEQHPQRQTDVSQVPEQDQDQDQDQEIEESDLVAAGGCLMSWREPTLINAKAEQEAIRDCKRFAEFSTQSPAAQR